MTTLRRFLVLAGIIFWQGGFMFYAGVVVPVGRAAIGVEQSVVTSQVTNYLNLAGAVALLPMAWDVRTSSSRRAWRCACWLGMAAGLLVLLWLHALLEAAIDPATAGVQNHQVFYPTHRWYLWVSTVQWAFAVAFIVLSLGAWRERDRLDGAGKRLVEGETTG